jgi:alkaline phosphatase isozyme conversion protein
MSATPALTVRSRAARSALTLATAAQPGIVASTDPGLSPDSPRGAGYRSDRVAFDGAGTPIVKLEATNWAIGDKDGYPQTAIREALPAGRVDERARDAVRILTALVAELAGVKP